MPEIRINTALMRQYSHRINAVYKRIDKLSSRIGRLSLGYDPADMHNILDRSVLLICKANLINIQNYLEITASEFESAENCLCNQNPMNFNLHNANIGDIISLSMDNRFGFFDILKTIGVVTMPGAAVGKSTSIWDKLVNGEYKKEISGAVNSHGDDDTFKKILFGTLGVSATTSNKYEKDDAFNEKIKDALEKKGKDLPKQSEDKYKEKNKDEKFYKKRGTIAEAKGEAKAEGSVLDGKASGDSKYAEGSAEGKVLTAEAHANAAGGLYVYEKDKDGNTKRVFSPGVSAEVGASASVLDGSAEGRVGLGKDKNALGLYGGVGAKVLTAEAKAKAAVNRKEAFVGASAEADVAKVDAHGGVSVLGTDVGVSGAVKFGIGAHANAGITDGKVKVDVGVAVGLGVDVGFEVDVGGTVKGITNGVKSICKGSKAAWTSFFK